ADPLAQLQNRCEVASPDGLRGNASGSLECARKRSICGANPNRTPLREAQLRQREDRKDEHEERHHLEISLPRRPTRDNRPLVLATATINYHSQVSDGMRLTSLLGDWSNAAV